MEGLPIRLLGKHIKTLGIAAVSPACITPMRIADVLTTLLSALCPCHVTCVGAFNIHACTGSTGAWGHGVKMYTFGGRFRGLCARTGGLGSCSGGVGFGAALKYGWARAFSTVIRLLGSSAIICASSARASSLACITPS